MNQPRDPRAFGHAVKTRREQLGLRQDELGARGGPSTTTLTKIENGSPTPVSKATLRKLDTGLDWPVGTAAAVLAGEPPPSSRDQPGQRPLTSVRMPRPVILPSPTDPIAEVSLDADALEADLDELVLFDDESDLAEVLDAVQTFAESTYEFIRKVQDMAEATLGGRARLVVARKAVVDQRSRGMSVEELPLPNFDDAQLAAYRPKFGEKGSKEAREQDELADRPDPLGPEGGA